MRHNSQASRKLCERALSLEMLEERRLLSVSFSSPKNIQSATMDSPFDVVTADFNRDGKQDFVASGNGSSNICVFLGTGEATFTSAEYAAGFNPRTIRTGDFNGDGYPDIAVANNDEGTVGVYINKGNGTFNSQATYNAVTKTYGLAVGDFTGDGKPDIIAGGETQTTLQLLKNNGSGTFSKSTTLTAGVDPVAVAAADLNHDGKLDVISANTSDNSLSVFLGNNNGTFGTVKTTPLLANSEPFCSLVAADFDGDGKIDVVAMQNGESQIAILWGKGDGTFETPKYVDTGTDPRDVVAADMNGDGRTDIVVATDNFGTTDSNGNAGGVDVFLNSGNRQFNAYQQFTAHDGPQGVAAADFNEDGKLDLVTANFFSDDSSVITNASALLPVVVDNHDPGVTVTGSWTSSTAAPGYIGNDYLSDGNAGKGTKSVKYTPNLPTTGVYQVLVRYTSGSTRASNVPIDIVHSGTTSTVSLNEQTGGGTWVSLGAYTFSAGMGNSVTIRTTGTNGYVIADAVEFVRASRVTVDNTAASYSGSWATSSGVPGFYGSDYRYNSGFGVAASATFKPAVTAGASYLIYARWAAAAGRADDTLITCSGVSGTFSTRVDQTRDNGAFVLIGQTGIPLGGSENVVISNASADGTVIADAVRLIAAGGGTLPGAVSNFTAAAASSTQINLSWTDNSGIESGYQVERSVNGGAYSVVAQLPANSHLFSDTGLLNGTSYTYRVRPFNGNGFGAYSPTKTAQTTGATQIIADNANPRVTMITGTWTSSTSAPGYIGTDYLADGNTGKGTKSVKFTPTITTAGTYNVYGRWSGGATRATNVPFDILHSGTTTTVLENQQTNGGVWVLLGTYTFAAGTGGSVTIRTTGTSGQVIADAVEFVKA